MKTGLVAFISFVVIPIAILTWDWFLYGDKIPRNSISQVVIDLSSKYPMVPFSIGFGMGLLSAHWFLGAWAI